jgi:GT2 family glycosyltransferase
MGSDRGPARFDARSTIVVDLAPASGRPGVFDESVEIVVERSRPLVSVIIPSRNRRNDLERCLRSIERQSHPAVEVIVVDDHSEDGSAEMVAARFPSVRFVRNTIDHGPPYVRNQGILLARGDYLLFLDSDSELEGPDVISTLVDSMALRPTIGCIGGEIPVYHGVRDRAHGRRLRFRGTTSAVAAAPGVGVERTGLVPCDYLATCGCFVKREAAVRIGGFDPHYGFGGEDVDFGIRIHQLGLDNYVLYEGAALHHKSPAARRDDETYLYQRTRIRFVWKNASTARVAAVTAIDALDVLTFYPILPLKLLAKLVLRRRIAKESFTGAALLVRAYLWNVERLAETRMARHTNFLETPEMKSFARAQKPREAALSKHTA